MDPWFLPLRWIKASEPKIPGQYLRLYRDKNQKSCKDHIIIYRLPH